MAGVEPNEPEGNNAPASSGAGCLTQLFRRAAEGDANAANEALKTVLPFLRAKATELMRSERSAHTLQPTALVNEAYIRIFGDNPVPVKDRGHFFCLIARTMRRVLVDHARGKCRQRRGGPQVPAGYVRDNSCQVEPTWNSVDFLALDQALCRFPKEHARAAQVVELKFFAGLSNEEVATALNVAVRTVFSDWKFAQAWLARELGHGRGAGEQDG